MTSPAPSMTSHQAQGSMTPQSRSMTPQQPAVVMTPQQHPGNMTPQPHVAMTPQTVVMTPGVMTPQQGGMTPQQGGMTPSYQQHSTIIQQPHGVSMVSNIVEVLLIYFPTFCSETCSLTSAIKKWIFFLWSPTNYNA